jgi:hypothetical protein
VTLYFYSTKLKVGSKYLYISWYAFEHQVRKSSLTPDVGEETEQCQKAEENWRT